jgi:two-component system chemotaxis sensor kinase CheA
LLQLCRNAVDHGIETPAERKAAGKPAEGIIRLRGELRGAEVLLTVADDGRGLDLPAVRQQAQRRGLPLPATAREAAAVVFSVGFSTAPSVTELSGRGVGLDVVKAAVESLHGTVALASEPGQGVSFTVRVPVTLTTFRAVLFRVGGHVFALPASAIRRLERLSPERIASVEGRDMLATPEGPIPLGSLAQAVGLPSADPSTGRAPVALIEVGTRIAALVIDELLEEREVLLKPLGRHLRNSRFVLGGTLLPDGQLALVLSAAELVRAFLSSGRGDSLAAKLTSDHSQARKRILVADDSITTRSLEKSIIESAGYDVLAVADGEEAWRVLQQRPVDLVVSDVEMPRMDGFALAEAIRGSRRWGRLPVVLVSALCSDADRARGLAVGANAYIAKGTFDQHELLQTISQLL